VTATVVVLLERVVRFAPFGVWFWDVAAQRPVRAGLEVVHRPRGGGVAVRAVANPSGVYVLSGLPGLAGVELGPEPHGSPPAGGRYHLEVTDPEGRYLPVAVDADLPLLGPGLFDPGCLPAAHPPWGPPAASPPAPPLPRVPLLPAPSRPVPAGMAVLRAQLELAPASPPGPGGAPAAWALLEVSFEGRLLGVGAADGNGLATVVFPYPEPPALDLSPPGPGSSPLADQTWPLQLAARFSGGPGPATDPPTARTAIPDLCALLDQAPATPLADGTGAPLTTVLLRYGRELVARTPPGSTLLLTPSGSPPSP
jgi:hypothetical protein